MQSPTNKTILSIVILNYNAKDVALASVKSIEENYPKEVASGMFQVILTDNASPDNSLKEFLAYKKKTKIKLFDVVDNGGNICFSGGNNKGVPVGLGEYIFFFYSNTFFYPKKLISIIYFLV